MKCEDHPDEYLYTPFIRSTGRHDEPLPLLWCRRCYQDGGINQALRFLQRLEMKGMVRVQP